MKTCTECGDWLDQAAPDGTAVCDACYTAMEYCKPPASYRARTVEQARAKQFAAMVKHGNASLLHVHAKVFQTIHDYSKFNQRQNRLEQIAENYRLRSSDFVIGWLKAFREMRGDPLLLVFCPLCAFWDDELLNNEISCGWAAAYRAIHKS